MIRSLISKTGIVWAFGIGFALFAGWLTFADVLGLQGWTWSRRFLELSRSHPGQHQRKITHRHDRGRAVL
jgi:hypothetical protein